MMIWRLHEVDNPRRGVFRAFDVNQTAARGHDPYTACKTPSRGFPFTDEDLAEAFDRLPRHDQDQFFFGFRTLAQYKAVWRYAENRRKLEEISRGKCVLVQYEVPDEYVISSDFQCVFKLEHARAVQSRKPTWVT